MTLQQFQAPSSVRGYPALSWRAVAFSAGGGVGSRLPEVLSRHHHL